MEYTKWIYSIRILYPSLASILLAYNENNSVQKKKKGQIFP